MAMVDVDAAEFHPMGIIHRLPDWVAPANYNRVDIARDTRDLADATEAVEDRIAGWDYDQPNIRAGLYDMLDKMQRRLEHKMAAYNGRVKREDREYSLVDARHPASGGGLPYSGHRRPPATARLETLNGE